MPGRHGGARLSKGWRQGGWKSGRRQPRGGHEAGPKGSGRGHKADLVWSKKGGGKVGCQSLVEVRPTVRRNFGKVRCGGIGDVGVWPRSTGGD